MLTYRLKELEKTVAQKHLGTEEEEKIHLLLNQVWAVLGERQGWRTCETCQVRLPLTSFSIKRGSCRDCRNEVEKNRK
jgi:hypothetical protein